MTNEQEDGASESLSFLTNHTRVLLCVARDPDVRMRTVAECVGVTERAVQKLITELAEAGYLTRHRVGRRNFYEIHAERPLHHPLESHRTVGDILKVLLERGDGEAPEDPEEDGLSRPGTASSTRSRRWASAT